jgi:hypothetical protein
MIGSHQTSVRGTRSKFKMCDVAFMSRTSNHHAFSFFCMMPAMREQFALPSQITHNERRSF